MRTAPTRVVPVLLAAAAALGGCRSDVPIIRDVPLVRDVLLEPPFPQGWRFVDLTRPLDGSAAHLVHPRQFPFERMDLAPSAKGQPRSGAFSTMEHVGTHVGAPRSRNDAGDTVDRFGIDEVLLPLVVIDVPEESLAENAVSDGAVRANERELGEIPPGAAVVLRTRAKPGAGRHPGWTGTAVRWLASARDVRVVGSDAPMVDAEPGEKTNAQFAASMVGVWTLQGLTNLEHVPQRGAWVMIGALPIVGGTAAPARVIALLPPAAAGKP